MTKTGGHRVWDVHDGQTARVMRCCTVGVQVQRQAKCLRRTLQAGGITKNHQLRRPIVLGGMDDQFRANARRFTRKQCKTRWHRT